MFRLWCEWDIGQDGLVFKEDSSAKEWFNNNENVAEILLLDGAQTEDPYKYYWYRGLANIEKLKVID